MCRLTMKLLTPFFLLTALGLFVTGCKEKPVKTAVKQKAPQIEKQDLVSIRGIRYTEVKRRFSNGLSFDTTGFQQKPSWIIQFSSDDTVKAFDPVQKIMQPFYLIHDRNSIFNFAKEWFRFKKISKDSLVFQRLQLNGKEVANDIRSDVNMTFYADTYIEKLRTTAEQLQRPGKADTIFISKLVKKANLDPGNRNSAFAATQIAQLIPIDRRISVEQISSVDRLNGKTEAWDYLYPRYRIVIPQSYKEFAYEFNLMIDKNGKMILGDSFLAIPEFRESRRKVLQGITDVYLQNLLKIKPGTTLGMPHSSEITVSVVGKKDPK